MKKELEKAAVAFRALDFSAENAKIAGLQAEVARMEGAIDRAEARCMEISQSLLAFQNRNRAAALVADALLDEAIPADAASKGPSEHDLRQERQSLRDGIGDLRRRIVDKQHEIKDAQGQAFTRLAPHIQPVIDAYDAEMIEHAQRMIEIHASLAAINAATRYGAKAEEKARFAAQGLTGPQSLIPSQRSLPIPDDVRSVLGNLADKGPALPAKFWSQLTLY